MDAVYGGILRMVVENPDYVPMVTERLSELVQHLEQKRKSDKPRGTRDHDGDMYKETRAWELLVELNERTKLPLGKKELSVLARVVTTYEEKKGGKITELPRNFHKMRKGDMVMWFESHLEESEIVFRMVEPKQEAIGEDTTDDFDNLTNL